MNLPKELTTVTKLSKYLALFLFIALPFVGFFLGVRYQEMMDLSKRQQEKSTLAIPRIPTLSPAEALAKEGNSIAIPTVDPSITANWKTYIRPDMKIKFKYPINVIIDRDESYVIWLAKKTESELDFRNRSILINIYEQEQGKLDYCEKGCIDVQINNLSGKMYSYVLEDKQHLNYYFPNPKKLGYILDVRYDEYDISVTEDDKDTFKAIISTLESIN